MKSCADSKATIIQKQQQRDAYAVQLKSMPPKVLSMEVTGRSTDVPVYVTALQKRNDAQQLLDGLRARYSDQHPKVKEARLALDVADAQLRKADTISKATPNVQQSTTISNPEYVHTLSLINEGDAELKGLRAGQELKEKQLEAAKKAAVAAGPKNFEFKSLVEERTTLRATRTDLESRLQTARLIQSQDATRAALGASLLVDPVAEPTIGGYAAALIYAIGPVLGLIIAVLLSLFLKSMDHSLRTAKDVEHRLGVPVLAVLPGLDKPRTAHRQLSDAAERDPNKLLSA